METKMTLFATFMVNHLLIGVALLIFLTVLFKLLKPSAELRSWLWVTAFVIAVLAPMVIFIGYPGSNKSDVAMVPINLNQTESQIDLQLQSTKAEILERQTMSGVLENSPQASWLQWEIPSQWIPGVTPFIYVLLIIWLAGSCWRLFRITRSLGKTSQLMKNTIVVDHRFLDRDQNEITVMKSEDAPTPLAVGLINPMVILPTTLVNKLELQQLAAIVLHEWAHIQRKDLWVIVLQEIISIVFWWSPVIRVLNRNIHVTRELACDMRAATNLSNGKQYAQSLLDCARLIVVEQRNILAMGIFGKKRDLTYRVTQVMNMKPSKSTNILVIIFACLGLAITCLAAAQSLTPEFKVAALDEKSKEQVVLNRSTRREKKLLKKWEYSERDSANEIEYAGEQEIREYMNELASENTGLKNNAIRLISLECNPDICDMKVKSINKNDNFAQQISSLLRNMPWKNVSISELSNDLTANILIPSVSWPQISTVLKSDDIHALDRLIGDGLDINASIPGDGTPLIIAVRAQNHTMVEHLIQLGADVNQAELRDGNPLIAAAMTGNVEFAELLYQYGADVNAVVDYDETPLINASRFGHFDMVRFLVERGADVNLGVNTRTRGDQTEFRSPLNQAANPKIREYLVRVGAQS